MKTLKIIFYPLLLCYRAYKVYRLGLHATKWGERIINGEILVSLNIPKGQFFIDARSHLLRAAITGEYEKKTMQLVKTFDISEGLIVNIGANIGFYSIQLANNFPENKILAIEPNPEAYRFLSKNIAQNNLVDRIKLLNVCISDKEGQVSFSIISGKPEYSSINGIVHNEVENEVKEIIEVNSLTLGNAIDGEKIAMIFMDVEGAEQLVLQGSIDILGRNKPLIFCECNDLLLKKFNSSSIELVNTLKNLGYTIMNAENRSLNIRHPFNGNLLALIKA
jgi:FkbM family methyltransferase